MSDFRPRDAYRQGFPWVPAVAVTVVVAVGLFALLYYFVIAPAGNVIDKANQSNQLKHEQRQSAIISQQNKNVYGSLAYQQSFLTAAQADLSGITGPGGLELTRESIPANSGEQASIRDQELYQVKEFCSDAGKVNPGNPAMGGTQPTLNQIYAANCTAGVPVADPPLAMNPIPDGGA